MRYSDWTGGLRRLVLVAALLALAAALAGGSALASSQKSLYVSAANGNDANPCSKAAPCETIGHAVAVAKAHDRIVVLAGTYKETVTVTKRLDLVGQGAVVDATSLVNGIVVQGGGASRSSVTGFTVENAEGEGILVVSTSRVTIQRNVVQDNDTGAGTDVTPECQDQGETPGDCGEALHLMSVTKSKVLDNTVQRNVGGILVTDELGPASGNLIAGNFSINNGFDCGITLPSHNGAAVSDPKKGGVYGNVVRDNVSLGNGGAGVGMFAPFPGTASYNNRVFDNVLGQNGEAGIAIHAHAPGQNVSGNVITGNQVFGNGIDPDSGSGAPTGIAIWSAASPVHVTVQGNHVDAETFGIFLGGPVSIKGLTKNTFGAGVTTPIGH